MSEFPRPVQRAREPRPAGKMAAAHSPAIARAIAAATLLAWTLLLGERPAMAAAAPSDRFVAGGTITESAPIAGDLFAAGGTIDVDASVAGDAVVAGGKVRLGADVGQSVYAAAGQLSLVGRVARNARLAGGNVDIAPTASIAGNLTVAGGHVAVRGAVEGQLRAGARSLLIDSKVAGDVDVAAGTVELGPNARIEGNLRYRSGDPLQRAASAQVLGSVERLAPDWSQAPRERTERTGRHVRTGLAVFWTLGVMLLAAVVVALLPRLSASVSDTLRARPGWSLLLGFIVLVCMPVAVLVLFITVIGIPLGILTLLAYLMLLPLAWVGSAIGVGDWVIRRVASARADRTGWRVTAALLAVLVLALLTRVPVLGGLVAFAVLLAGLGAWAMQLRRLGAR